MLYSAKVMDHFSHPRNVGEMPDATAVGEVGNAKCGDIMKIYLKIDENDIITDCSFETFGCASAIATSSMATELIKGQPLSKALELTNSAVVEALGGLPPAKITQNATASLKTLKEEEEKEKAAEEAKKERIAKQIEESNKLYNTDAKPGSIAAKAAMVQKYNEAHEKRK